MPPAPTQSKRQLDAHPALRPNHTFTWRSLSVDVVLVHRGGGGRGALAGVHLGRGAAGSEGHMDMDCPAASQSNMNARNEGIERGR